MEDRIQKALAAYKKNHKKKIAVLAREHEILYSTLYRRIYKQTSPRTANGTNALTKSQEEAVKEWIRRQSRYGISPSPNLLRDCANSILASEGKREVSKMWAYRFAKRLGPEFNSTKQRPINPKCIRSEDIGIIQTWFDRLEIYFRTRRIGPSSIYNFDETGFRIGQGKVDKVMTTASNRELASVIECICADGTAIPPLIILKGQRLMQKWYTESNIKEQDWVITASKSGNSNDILGLQWLRHFIKHTKEKKNKVLLMDGHGSHITKEFIELAERNYITLYAHPSHTSHFLQPLGIPFQQYKHFYGKEVNALTTRSGITSINKVEFLNTLVTIRPQTFTPRIIRAGFQDRGIYPFNPAIVIDKLAKNSFAEENIIAEEGALASSSDLDLSSSIHSSPTSIVRLRRNIQDAKILASEITSELTNAHEEFQRKLDKIYHRSLAQAELGALQERDLQSTLLATNL